MPAGLTGVLRCGVKAQPLTGVELHDINDIDQAVVVVNGTKLVDEIQKMPDEKMSLVGGLGEVQSIPFHVRLEPSY